MPPPRSTHALLVALLVALPVALALAPLPGRAQPVSGARMSLGDAEAALARYDLASARTWEALAALRGIADENGADAAHARFVRAFAGVELLVAASVLDDADALRRLEEGFGVSSASALSGVLDAELARAPRGALGRASADARALLATLNGRSPTRLDTRTATVALLRAAEAPEALAPYVFAHVEPAIDASLDVIPEHAERARRLVRAVRTLDDALSAAQAGDPLFALLRGRLEAARARLGEIVLTNPDFADIDGFLTLSPDAIAFGYVPRTRVDVSGRPILESGRPVWPQTTRVDLPGDASSSARPLRDLAQNPLVTGAHPARVALRVEGAVSVSLLARVLRALEGSPLTVTHVATTSGRVPVRILGEASAGPAPPIQIVVRPGGYVIRRRGARSVDVPRLRLDGWQYDHEALVHGVPESGERVVTGTGLASAAELLEVAVLVSRESGVTLALP